MTAAARLDLTFWQGTDYALQLEFEDAAGAAIDMSAYTDWQSEVRRRRSRTSDELGAFTFDTTNAATGIIVLSLPKATTVLLPECCHWDVDVTDPNGDLVTLFYGEVNVPRDVTVPSVPPP